MTYTAEDFKYCNPPRLMGSETEYTTARGLHELNWNDEKYVLFKDRTEFWLVNGARLYQDCVDITEYATPECLTASQVAAHEIAGGLLVKNIFSQEASDKGSNREQAVYKRSGYELVVHNGTVLLEPQSTGHHENYFFLSSPDEKVFINMALRSYLATRSVWAGAGLVANYSYSNYQKHSAMQFKDSKGPELTNHGCKPLYLYHDDRLEIRSGDGNMSPWVIQQKYAFSSLVLRLIQHGKFPEDLIIANQGDKAIDRAAYLSAYSPDYVISYDLPFSPIEHQMSIAKACLEYADSSEGDELSREEVSSAEEILRTCQDIEKYYLIPENLYLISDRLDWAAKLHRMIQSGINLSEMNTLNLDAVKMDLEWENVDEHSLSSRWYRKYGNTIAKNILGECQLVPPSNTRARRRVEFIKKSAGTIDQVEWAYVTTLKAVHHIQAYEN